MGSLARKIRGPLPFASALCGVRHGHMVKLPGNKWDTRDWERKPKKWIPIKGTKGFKLDTIEPPDGVLHKDADPRIVEYSYQLDPYPRTKSCDPVKYLCAITKTAVPLHLSELNHSNDSQLLSEFVEYVTECCDSFNRLFNQKDARLSQHPTPLELDSYARIYASGFLQNMLNFLHTSPVTGELLKNSHLSTNLQTGTFWRNDIILNKPARKRVKCFSFQLSNFIDLMVRSVHPLSYEALRSDTNPDVTTYRPREAKPMFLPNLCTNRLQLFKEKREVEQYPGFIKETIYPYNHTLFKVVSSTLSDRALQATAMMTGFGQTVATTQHRLDFVCRVDLLPAVRKSEAVNVVVTDGNRYCLGVYQCNTTNMCGTQISDKHVNCCALSDVQTIVREGRVNEQLLGDILGMLTAQRHELEEEEILPGKREKRLMRRYRDIEH